MSGMSSWLGLLLSTDAPALPQAWVMRLGLTLGWALVLASLGAGLARKRSLRTRRSLAAVLVLWNLLPGPLTPDYWLGLAFHAPSLSAMLLCAWCLQRWLWAPTLSATASKPAPAARAGVWLLVLLGYVLLLDTFAVLPLQIYAWGFSPLLLLVLLALSLLPWLWRGSANGVQARWLVPLALLLFALTRLPTGNLWDALLDPWLWLLLQGLLIRSLVRRA